MKVILFGATGMVGRGALLECLDDTEVEEALTIGRSEIDLQHEKLRQIVRADPGDLDEVENSLSGYDACFFCLGASSAGMNEEAYRKITYELTLAVAERLARLNPQMTFIYVSGQGADSSEQGKTMWANVRGATENALLRLPFRAVHILRPGMIQPLRGVRSKTTSYRVVYFVMRPVLPLLRRLFPDSVTNTVELGRAMLALAKHARPPAIWKGADFRTLATGLR